MKDSTRAAAMLKVLAITLMLAMCNLDRSAFAQQNDASNLSPNNNNNNNNNNDSSDVKIQFVNVNGQPVLVQFTYVGPPKILPIATADSYPEGSTINLICTVSGGQRKGLTLGWLKDGELLSDESLRFQPVADNNVSIENTGADISILRVSNATHANSGRFTCVAKNPLGEDSTSVNIVINVELKWTKMPNDVEVGLNQDLVVECDAFGQPPPQIAWTRLPGGAMRAKNETKAIVMSSGKVLKLTRAQLKDSGLYECKARNGVDEDLRRIIQVKVRGGNKIISISAGGYVITLELTFELRNISFRQ